MPEKKHRNPFEDHINSESFDVSRLDDVPPLNEMSLEIQTFLDNLPQPLNHELWDTELDERQKTICAHLTTELIEQVLRIHYAEELQDFSDDQLIYIFTVPVTLAMLAEERLHEKPQPLEPQPEMAQQAVMNHPNAFESMPTFRWSGLRETVRRWFQDTKYFFMRLFKRY